MNRQLTSTLLAFLFSFTLLGGTAFAAPAGQYRAEPANPPSLWAAARGATYRNVLPNLPSMRSPVA